MTDFQNKTVIVTGAGSGIGRAIARAYAGRGARVAMWDRNGDGLKQTAQGISKNNVLLRQIDLTNPDEIIQAVSEAADTFDGIDILVNNAGLGISASPYALSLDDWDYVLNTNLRGSFLCSREAARFMKKAGNGSIVNIASTRALMSEANTEAYAASKGGILALTHALAISLGPDHIKVNAISPGWIETKDYEKLRKKDHTQHPAGRVGKVDDIVKACFYLTDPENDFVTGTNLVVDGGMTRKMIYEE